MPKALDLAGQRFGALVAVAISGSKDGRNVWLCKCDCGGERHELAKMLNRGMVKDCGPNCQIRKPYRNHADLTGRTFHWLTVIGELDAVQYASGQKPRFLCRCKCGNEIKVLGLSLTSGNSKSCGCWRKQVLSERSKHRLTKTRGYRIWQNMLNRCRNTKVPAHKNWGGRGITVCEAWLKFDTFITDMGEPPLGCSIDRIDNDGNYEPQNCRWATPSEQSRNTRRNRIITFQGESLCLQSWAEKLNMSRSSLMRRLDKWPVSVALTRPVKGKSQRPSIAEWWPQGQPPKSRPSSSKQARRGEGWKCGLASGH